MPMFGQFLNFTFHWVKHGWQGWGVGVVSWDIKKCPTCLFLVLISNIGPKATIVIWATKTFYNIPPYYISKDIEFVEVFLCLF